MFQDNKQYYYGANEKNFKSGSLLFYYQTLLKENDNERNQKLNFISIILDVTEQRLIILNQQIQIISITI